MKLLADEGVDRQIVALIRDEGHDVAYVLEMEPGISDEAVLDLANREARILLTADKDFGELVFRQGLLAPGVILIRLSALRVAAGRQGWRGGFSYRRSHRGVVVRSVRRRHFRHRTDTKADSAGSGKLNRSANTRPRKPATS